ncbi:porin [Rhodobacteraceae bacterium W635]|uniref:porin n=1 Tax=Nioella halotolerans TaxID=2303578 RepID=UPI000E3CC7A6|nr:porin [Rhodobacteraceae bacterium W635]
MKKVLFATTALVATAGVASADITLSGSAEMGIMGGSYGGVLQTAADPNAQFHTDIDVTFTMSGETDNGLTFGATVDLDENGAFAANTQGGETIFISGNFGTLTMGDTDGAFDWAMSEVPVGSGSLTDASTVHAGFNANSGFDGVYDGQILRYDHSIGGFGFGISIELDDADGTSHVLSLPIGTTALLANAAGTGPVGSTPVAFAATDSADPIIGLGLTYTANLGGTDVNFGLGYQTMGITVGAVSADPSVLGLSVGTTVSGISLGLNYSTTDYDVAGLSDQTHMGIGASYTMDAITVGVNYGQYNDRYGASGFDASGVGLSAGYDLGGGASILFGYATDSIENPAGVELYETDQWTLGVSMSF